ncbi:hypothetical protein Syun_014673 [Stephania yunnanensis]|uniref:SNF2 N-terminal domain-containing protein n=1 Tax=Stephania yunnanensis TaxID=152371 RepID=A0AAP0JJS4_9MAGN
MIVHQIWGFVYAWIKAPPSPSAPNQKIKNPKSFSSEIPQKTPKSDRLVPSPKIPKSRSIVSSKIPKSVSFSALNSRLSVWSRWSLWSRCLSGLSVSSRWSLSSALYSLSGLFVSSRWSLWSHRLSGLSVSSRWSPSSALNSLFLVSPSLARSRLSVLSLVVVMMSDVGKVELPYCLRPVKEQTLDQVLYNVLKKRFVMPRRLLMTGTPIQNNLSELWALMHFCAPLVFGKLEQFLFTFREATGTSGFHVALVALRVAPLVMQLRKTCSHPYLFPGIEPEPYVEGEHLVQAVPPYERPALTKGYLFPLDYKLAHPPSVPLSVVKGKAPQLGDII